MAAFDTFRPVGTVRPGLFARFWADTFGSVATWADNRATYKALSKLSDRELDDIGLSRSDLDALDGRR